jgi:hypothetical protein
MYKNANIMLKIAARDLLPSLKIPASAAGIVAGAASSQKYGSLGSSTPYLGKTEKNVFLTTK